MNSYTVKSSRYLITVVPQVGGGERRIYARSARAAREAREEIRLDPAKVECVDVAEYVDVEPDGTRWRYVLDGAS